MAVTFKTKHEIGWKIFEDLHPDIRYEISKHLMDEERFYIIEKVFGMLHEYHRYKFMRDYNMKFLKVGLMNFRSVLYHSFNIGIYGNDGLRPGREDEIRTIDECENYWKYCEETRKRLFKKIKTYHFLEDKMSSLEKENKFLKNIAFKKRIYQRIQEYESDIVRNEREMKQYIRTNYRKLPREHYSWCEYRCKFNHRCEMEFCKQQRLKTLEKSAANAVRISIKRFQKVYHKKYPNSKIEINAEHLQNLLTKRIKWREVFYELELELIPLTYRIYQIKYLHEYDNQ